MGTCEKVGWVEMDYFGMEVLRLHALETYDQMATFEEVAKNLP